MPEAGICHVFSTEMKCKMTCIVTVQKAVKRILKNNIIAMSLLARMVIMYSVGYMTSVILKKINVDLLPQSEETKIYDGSWQTIGPNVWILVSVFKVPCYTVLKLMATR